MTISIRLDPTIEAELTRQAKLLGMKKSEFIRDAIERALGMKNPAVLLQEVRSGGRIGRRNASANVSRLMRLRLSTRRSATN